MQKEGAKMYGETIHKIRKSKNMTLKEVLIKFANNTYEENQAEIKQTLSLSYESNIE